ncbi:hypothetical protein Bbelb_444050 [Branchiostoma belcheri]|nr:hypothetical protein Bbelb_444050 [Branchiostoma belcheri]
MLRKKAFGSHYNDGTFGSHYKAPCFLDKIYDSIPHKTAVHPTPLISSLLAVFIAGLPKYLTISTLQETSRNPAGFAAETRPLICRVIFPASPLRREDGQIPPDDGRGPNHRFTPRSLTESPTVLKRDYVHTRSERTKCRAAPALLAERTDVTRTPTCCHQSSGSDIGMPGHRRKVLRR